MSHVSPLQSSNEEAGVPERGGTLGPTRVRYGVVAFLAAMTFVLYLDRLCISQAAPIIQKEWDLTNSQLSLIFGAFALSYALFEVPAGRWGDRFGSRGVLTRIVIWWSIFTALTGAAWGFAMLVVIRFLFGAGEAGALPNSARVLREWFPDSSRARAQGIVTTAMLLGGAAAPRASQWLINVLGWRWTFVVFALCGVAWAIAFYVWFRDDPAAHPATNEAERLVIAAGRKATTAADSADDALATDSGHDGGLAHRPIPWGRIVRSGNVWLLSALVALSSAIYELFSSWYPKYLQSARGASEDLSSWLTSMVLAAGPCAALFGGWFSDWLVQRTGDHRWGRTAQATAGWGLTGLSILASVWIDSTTTASVCMALGVFGLQLALPSWWSCATQISGRHVGAIFGLMNMFGSLGRIMASAWVGVLADWRKGLNLTGRAQWDPALYGFAGAAVVGMILWALVDPRKPVDDRPATKDDPLAAGGG
jgi:ACS family glucarate transporter-like MFS transporter